MTRIPPALLRASTFATCAGEFMVERTPPHLYAGERALLGLVLPPFQRPAVWDVGRQRQFVESLFLGLNSTAIVVTDNEWRGRRGPLPWLPGTGCRCSPAMPPLCTHRAASRWPTC